MGNSESKEFEDVDFFNDISSDILNNPDNYREAGEWLDNYCSSKSDFDCQETELKKKKSSESCTCERQTHTQLPYAKLSTIRQDLIKKLKDQSSISLEVSRQIILVCWILTDSDAEKSNIKITTFQDWHWEPLDDIIKMSRGFANNVWRENIQDYNELVKITRLAWKTIIKDNETKSSGKIVYDEINLGIFKISSQNFKKAKWWIKYPVMAIICIFIIFTAWSCIDSLIETNETEEQESVDINGANKNTTPLAIDNGSNSVSEVVFKDKQLKDGQKYPILDNNLYLGQYFGLFMIGGVNREIIQISARTKIGEPTSLSVAPQLDRLARQTEDDVVLIGGITGSLYIEIEYKEEYYSIHVDASGFVSSNDPVLVTLKKIDNPTMTLKAYKDIPQKK